MKLQPPSQSHFIETCLSCYLRECVGVESPYCPIRVKRLRERAAVLAAKHAQRTPAEVQAHVETVLAECQRITLHSSTRPMSGRQRLRTATGE